MAEKLNTGIEFDLELIKRYDKSAPRYTSYPTAASFHEGITENIFSRHARHSNEDPIPGPLSLYVHIPFCDTLCFYCACNKIASKNKALADTYLDYVDKEARLLARYFDHDREVTQLHWGGGTPTFLRPEQAARLMHILGKYFSLLESPEREYSIEIDPRSIDRAGVHHLAEIGFNRFSLGVQDVNPEVQQAVNRIQPESLTREIVEACRETGAKSLNLDLIYGLPLQTLEGFGRSLDSVIDISPDRLSVFNYAHLPSLFYPQKRIHEKDLPSPAVKLDMMEMTINKLTDAGYVYIGMDHFAKPDDELALALADGSLHRNFQGYTTHSECDLVGIGVSSIGSLERLFTQNEKTLEAYYARLDNDELPIARGVELIWDDCIRRAVIQDLMCRNEVVFFEIKDQYACEFDSYFEEELKVLEPMQADGLLTVDDERIRITPKGRLLVRNIAMVFDKASQKLQEKKRFSKAI